MCGPTCHLKPIPCRVGRSISASLLGTSFLVFGDSLRIEASTAHFHPLLLVRQPCGTGMVAGAPALHVNQSHCEFRLCRTAVSEDKLIHPEADDEFDEFDEFVSPPARICALQRHTSEDC